MTVANIIKKIANRVIKSKRKKLFKLEVVDRDWETNKGTLL